MQQTHRDTGREQFAIPRPVILVRDCAGVLALQHAPDAFLHSLKSLPVTARRHGVALLPVAFILLGIPGAAADAFNQFAADTIALDRQRMIRVCHIGIVHALHKRLYIARETGRFREAVNNRLPHLLP